MTNELKVFESVEFGSVRVVEKDGGEPWFVASDVAKALGYERPNEAVNKHCKKVNKFSYGKSAYPYNIIPKAEVFRLVLRSNLPSAERFQDWVCEEVLTAIDKTGGYLAATPDDTPETILARAVLVAQDTLARVERERDEAVRTKAEIGSRREATAMATASAATRKASTLEAQLGIAGDYRAVKGIKWLPDMFDLSKSAVYSQIGKYIKKLSLNMGYAVKQAPDSLHESVGLYHVDVVKAFLDDLNEHPSILSKYRHA